MKAYRNGMKNNNLKIKNHVKKQSSEKGNENLHQLPPDSIAVVGGAAAGVDRSSLVPGKRRPFWLWLRHW